MTRHYVIYCPPIVTETFLHIYTYMNIYREVIKSIIDVHVHIHCTIMFNTLYDSIKGYTCTDNIIIFATNVHVHNYYNVFELATKNLMKKV